ncbi:hypothetical protein DL93DRAFT_2081146 [Clavulina sp. PMI_390]|nr:hypothetical protein DL93DRAFT_2081146 [Clavulina sp. PMI_390]
MQGLVQAARSRQLAKTLSYHRIIAATSHPTIASLAESAAQRRRVSSTSTRARLETPPATNTTTAASSPSPTSSAEGESSPVHPQASQFPPPPPPPHESQPNAHKQFYREFVPAMIPIFLLGSAVYMSLTLTREYLSYEKYASEAQARINELENELQELRIAQERAAAQPLSTSTTKSTPTGKSSGMLGGWWGKSS